MQSDISNALLGSECLSGGLSAGRVHLRCCVQSIKSTLLKSKCFCALCLSLDVYLVKGHLFFFVYLFGSLQSPTCNSSHVDLKQKVNTGVADVIN